MLTFSEAILNKLRNLPDQPGVYRFLDKKEKILYIGKAKSLKKRVTSYFTGISKHSYRIMHLVKNIHDLVYTITNTEIEALSLENSLIKQHQPKYNILLKDGKTYPYICITNERFPRVFSARQKTEPDAQYFGPYVNPGVMYTILDLIKDYIRLRTCNYNLSEENIHSGKFRVCLEYQIGNCLGPCVGKQSEADYMKGIDQIKHILKGNFAVVLDQLEMQMLNAAEQYQFETAEKYRKKMEQVMAYRKKNTIVSDKLNDLEVFSVIMEESLALIHHFKIHNGTIIQTHTWEHKRNLEETEGEILSAAFSQWWAEEKDIYPEVIVNHLIEDENLTKHFQFVIPKIGDKKKLLDLSEKNAIALLKEKLYNQNFREKKTPNVVMMEELKKVLHLKELPDHIECFDNSNFQGSFPVSSMVVFRDGKPAKRDYRHFNVKTVEGPNDFATMEEVVERRYKRVLEENLPLPKLIIIDGGKGQLGAAVKAMEKVGIAGKVPVIGIAKRLEEIYSPGDSLPLHIDKKSAALILIQRCRDEAHRFGITFHRDKRSKGQNQRSFLTQIEGIGENTEKVLLQHFKSVKKIKSATESQLSEIVGKHKAGIILNAIQEGKI
ncbi:MAG: excinuclease ABC subunit UvrC [Bacteroidia bacterium]|nr:excinuclease ABC subunit UvrC [Bacteroidia bacterium]